MCVLARLANSGHTGYLSLLPLLNQLAFPYRLTPRSISLALALFNATMTWRTNWKLLLKKLLASTGSMACVVVYGANPALWPNGRIPWGSVIGAGILCIVATATFRITLSSGGLANFQPASVAPSPSRGPALLFHRAVEFLTPLGRAVDGFLRVITMRNLVQYALAWATTVGLVILLVSARGRVVQPPWRCWLRSARLLRNLPLTQAIGLMKQGPLDVHPAWTLLVILVIGLQRKTAMGEARHGTHSSWWTARPRSYVHAPVLAQPCGTLGRHCTTFVSIDRDKPAMPRADAIRFRDTVISNLVPEEVADALMRNMRTSADERRAIVHARSTIGTTKGDSGKDRMTETEHAHRVHPSPDTIASREDEGLPMHVCSSNVADGARGSIKQQLGESGHVCFKHTCSWQRPRCLADVLARGPVALVEPCCPCTLPCRHGLEWPGAPAVGGSRGVREELCEEEQHLCSGPQRGAQDVQPGGAGDPPVNQAAVDQRTGQPRLFTRVPGRDHDLQASREAPLLVPPSALLPRSSASQPSLRNRGSQLGCSRAKWLQ